MQIMGVMFDYFAAGSDETAAAMIDDPGGPGGPLRGSADLGDALPSSDRDAIAARRGLNIRSSATGTLALRVNGIDPAVQLATLESLLTGVAAEDVMAGPRAAMVLAQKRNEDVLVVTLTDELQQGLISARPSTLESVAERWSDTEEFWGSGDPEELDEFLDDFAELARRAADRNERLYCWISL
jgi:hypothetical protein